MFPADFGRQCSVNCANWLGCCLSPWGTGEPHGPAPLALRTRSSRGMRSRRASGPKTKFAALGGGQDAGGFTGVRVNDLVFWLLGRMAKDRIPLRSSSLFVLRCARPWTLAAPVRSALRIPLPWAPLLALTLVAPVAAPRFPLVGQNRPPAIG